MVRPTEGEGGACVTNKQVENCFLNHNSSIHFSCADSLLMTHRGGFSLNIIIWKIGGGGPNILLAALVMVTEESGPYLCINLLFVFMCIIWWMCQCWNFTHMCKSHAWSNHSIRGKGWANTNNLAPPLFIEVPILSQESVQWCICVALSMIFRLVQLHCMNGKLGYNY